MQVDSGGSVSGDRYNRRVRILDKASGSNTFEIVVAMPAKDWGGILLALLQVENDGKQYKIMLLDGTVDGKAINGA